MPSKRAQLLDVLLDRLDAGVRSGDLIAYAYTAGSAAMLF
jgi:hypothetical protein